MGEDPILYQLRQARERHGSAIRRLNALLRKEEPSPDILRAAMEEEKEAREGVDLLMDALRLIEAS